MLNSSDYFAMAVDIDGEVNLIRKDGTIDTLFLRGTVEGLSEIRQRRSDETISWLFYFVSSPHPGDPKVKRLHLEYLDNA